jgi:hypothetical protein
MRTLWHERNRGIAMPRNERGIDLPGKVKWKTKDDEQKARSDLVIYGSCLARDTDDGAEHIPLTDVYKTDDA